MYDPASESLCSLEDVPKDIEETIEADFLGGRQVFEGVLSDYVSGRLDKKTMKPRTRYAQVLDMKRLKDDIRMNCVNERSFHCIDKSFFMEGFSLSDRTKPSVRLTENLSPNQPKAKSKVS